MYKLAGLAIAILFAASTQANDTITLCADGHSDYVILLSRDAIPAEHTAAKELQEHLEQVTGVKIPVQDIATDTSVSKAIVVGQNDLFRAAFPNITPESIGHDGIVMKTQGDMLFLAGDQPRGTLYAVYSFLEDIVGCRWWTASECSIPKRPTLEIPSLDVVYAPRLLSREAFYRGAFDGVFSARLKVNGHHHRVDPAYGGHYSILGWCHTFNQLLPPEKYFNDHPEWYSEIDGKRVKERSQLCLTNREMRNVLIKNALAWIRDNPDAGIISISQNDWHGRCQCAECRALEEREGGVPSGPLIHFVNAVAEEIEKEFPEVLVETLAYSYTRQAPKEVKPRHNVIIRLCSIECSYSQPLTGPQNETFKNDIETWSAIAHQLYIWNYVTNFSNYILPHPNMRVLAPNLRFFVDHKAIGLFEQGDSGCSCSDFPELRAWLLAHLMWDPQRNEEALIDEFLTGYYGAAAPFIREYINLIHDAAEASDVYLRCYMSDTSAWLPLNDLNRATALFDESETAVADDAVLTKRVQRARMPLDHVWINRYAALKRMAKGEGIPFAGSEDPLAFANDFVKRAHDFNVGNYREGRPFSEYETRLLHRFRKPGTPPARCEKLDTDDWVDIQDNEFRFAHYGEWVSIVDDPNASDGKAARMPANHTQWATQYTVSADVTALGPVHCYMVARCEAKASQGNAFNLGIWDSQSNTSVARTTVSINDAAGKEYHEYDLGVHELTPTMYMWAAPMNNSDQVEAVFVDRIYYVQETP